MACTEKSLAAQCGADCRGVEAAAGAAVSVRGLTRLAVAAGVVSLTRPGALTRTVPIQRPRCPPARIRVVCLGKSHNRLERGPPMAHRTRPALRSISSDRVDGDSRFCCRDTAIRTHCSPTQSQRSEIRGCGCSWGSPPTKSTSSDSSAATRLHIRPRRRRLHCCSPARQHGPGQSGCARGAARKRSD